MSRTVFCQKLQKDAEGLTFKPFPGELGDKIYDNISQEAWSLWLNHQTMLINEKRLSLVDEQAQTFLAEQMENFLFGGEYEQVEGYIPQEKQ